DEAQAENEDFLNKLDDNIKKIIKEQVKAQVSKILPKIEKTVNEQLEAEVMTRSSTESKTSLAIATNLSELELKKILIDKMEGNKLIHRSDEQKNLYKALVEAYESDKLILYTYGDTVSFKRRRDVEDKDEEPSTGSNRESKRKRAGKEPESTIDETPQPSEWFQKPTRLPSPNHDWKKTLPADLGPVQPWLSNLAWEEGPRKSFDKLMDTPLDFSAFMMNRLKVDSLTPELLADPTFELMKGTCKRNFSLGTKRQQFYGFAANGESARDVYYKRRIIDVTKLQIVEWHGYKHLDWMTVHRDDDKLTNLNVEDHLAFGVSLRMFTRTYSNPRGFIYHNKDKKNKLICIDELHKFSDSTLDDVRTVLNDHLKGIRIEYLPQTI
ncbi:hypothetical protein Tco_1117539, partial [Tanacetum coccineum]